MSFYELIDDPLSPYIEDDSWHANRASTLRGSDANVLAKGKPEDVRRLWRFKTGRQKRSTQTPSMAMLLGKATEDLNWRYFSKVYNRPVWSVQADLVHPEHKWLGLSADGVTLSSDGREAYLETKCVSAFKDIKRLFGLNSMDFVRLISSFAWEREIVFPVLVQEYYAQLQHAMFVGGWEVSVLCAIVGNQQIVGEVEFDPDYWDELFELEHDFWQCVEADEKPGEEVYRGVKLEEQEVW